MLELTISQKEREGEGRDGKCMMGVERGWEGRGRERIQCMLDIITLFLHEIIDSIGLLSYNIDFFVHWFHILRVVAHLMLTICFFSDLFKLKISIRWIFVISLNVNKETYHNVVSDLYFIKILIDGKVIWYVWWKVCLLKILSLFLHILFVICLTW